MEASPTPWLRSLTWHKLSPAGHSRTHCSHVNARTPACPSLWAAGHPPPHLSTVQTAKSVGSKVDLSVGGGLCPRTPPPSTCTGALSSPPLPCVRICHTSAPWWPDSLTRRCQGTHFAERQNSGAGKAMESEPHPRLISRSCRGLQGRPHPFFYCGWILGCQRFTLALLTNIYDIGNLSTCH